MHSVPEVLEDAAAGRGALPPTGSAARGSYCPPTLSQGAVRAMGCAAVHATKAGKEVAGWQEVGEALEGRVEKAGVSKVGQPPSN